MSPPVFKEVSCTSAAAKPRTLLAPEIDARRKAFTMKC
jgi:hypothetical protein